MSPLRVLVADDHALFRRGLVELLAEEPDIQVVGEAADGREAMARAEALAPEVILMDVAMPGTDGVAATAALCQREPPPRVLMLTVAEDSDTLFRALAAGARGYVLKTASPQEILEALRQVAQGWVVVSPAIAPLLASRLRGGERGASPSPYALPPQAGLTRREEEVLRLISRGLTNPEIAQELVVSPDTVKSHVRAILDKLQARSKREAMTWARKQGLA
ncbi:MAG: response regulator transcription factor [Chloroflexi bacterium]|nr:response regulator transcription factor [Chloroflexota bacterium]